MGGDNLKSSILQVVEKVKGTSFNSHRKLAFKRLGYRCFYVSSRFCLSAQTVTDQVDELGEISVNDSLAFAREKFSVARKSVISGSEK